jgi:hypothetical protein
MIWTYLLAKLPIDDVTITPGSSTDEQVLEELWEDVLPLCAPNLRRLALAFENFATPGTTVSCALLQQLVLVLVLQLREYAA